MTLREAFYSYVISTNELYGYDDKTGRFTFKLGKYHTSYEAFVERNPDPDLALEYLLAATKKVQSELARKKQARLDWETYMHFERNVPLDLLVS